MFFFLENKYILIYCNSLLVFVLVLLVFHYEQSNYVHKYIVYIFRICMFLTNKNHR